MSWRRGLRRFLGSSCVLVLCWLAGFGLYLADLANLTPPTPQTPPNTPTAIVVLTGGSERVATGINLLRQDQGQQLFISGIGSRSDQELLRTYRETLGDKMQCCVTLGHQAEDTIGNATESTAWLQQRQINRIILVTAHYHMRRSLVLFATTAPALEIIPYPVMPGRVQIAGWWQRPRTALLFFTEYNKLLVTLLRYGL